jgi:uncharacterized protein
MTALISPADGHPRAGGRDLRSTGVFLALAFGLSWLVALPLWLGDGLASPLFPVLSIGVMMTPAIAALIVVFFVERRRHPARRLGLWPLKPYGRLGGYLILGFVTTVVLVLAALPVGALLGVYPADITNFSAFRQVLDAKTGGAELPLPIGVLAVAQLAALPLGAIVNIIPTLGEELGWRGWLLPRLMPLGTLPALLISGVIWGLWHAPLILLGYNYGRTDALGVLLMTGFCVLVGVGLGALRLRSGCVWPGAVAHGCVNTASSVVLLVFSPDPVHGVGLTLLGPTGWVVMALLAAALATVGVLRAQVPTPAKAEGAPGGPR